MLLSDIELRAEIESGRLVFDPPLPEPAIQSASIDLSLHDVFWRPKAMDEGIIDLDRAQVYAYLDELRADSTTWERDMPNVPLLAGRASTSVAGCSLGAEPG